MKRIRRIVISQQKGGVKFAEQQGKGDRYISVTNNTLSKMLETEGVEAVETEILREVFEGDIVFNGNHESLTVFRKAWTEWRDFYFNSDKSVEVLHEILRSIHNEIEENQTSCIKCVKGYYAGFYSVNGKLYMYSTEEMPDVNVVYYKSAVSAKKVLRLLEQCENYDQYKPRIVIKSNKETTEGLEELAKWCEEKKVPLEFEGFKKESFANTVTFTKKYHIANVSYKIEANMTSKYYVLYFKEKRIATCKNQKELIDFFETYCPKFPRNIGKTTKFAKYLASLSVPSNGSV